MNRIALFALAAVLILVAWFGYSGHAVKAARLAEQSSMAAQTQVIVTATNTFLDTLSPAIVRR